MASLNLEERVNDVPCALPVLGVSLVLLHGVGAAGLSR